MFASLYRFRDTFIEKRLFFEYNSTIDQNKTLKHLNTQLAVRYNHSILAHEPIWSVVRVMAILHVSEMNVAFGSKNPTGVSQLVPLEVGVSILLYIFEKIGLFSP
ncbi:hypothetical protein CN941_15700 [Bacillus cereus]|nr:hypothetical protein CN941_15700 [Bacillus cereus]